MIKELKYIEDKIEDKEMMICFCDGGTEADLLFIESLSKEIFELYGNKLRLISINLDIASKQLEDAKFEYENAIVFVPCLNK